jgi:hypothetical protein
MYLLGPIGGACWVRLPSSEPPTPGVSTYDPNIPRPVLERRKFAVILPANPDFDASFWPIWQKS